MNKIEKEQAANAVLHHFKQGKYTADKTRRLIFTILGENKTAACKLDRLRDSCSIALYTKPNGECGVCGHFIP